MSVAQIEEECAAADEEITRRLGARPRYFAYPYGRLDARVRQCVGPRYRACLSTELRPLSANDDPGALPRLDSYYLRAPWLRRRLDAAPARLYLALRRRLRRLRDARARPWSPK